MRGRVSVVGLGPGGWGRVTQEAQTLLLDPDRRVIVRTLDHPAALRLAEKRPVESADSLYGDAETFEEVYERLAELVVDAAIAGEDVVLAVPGSPLVGERATSLVRRKAAAASVGFEIVPGESFVEAAWAMLNIDPLERGFQLLDGRNLPDPLTLDIPTLIAQVDVPLVLSDVAGVLAAVLPEGTRVFVLTDLGQADAAIDTVGIEDLAEVEAGPRLALFVDPAPHGWSGLVQTMRRLRKECPWDVRQTHESLVPHVVEETFELVDAISSLGDEGEGAFADLEEELGDVLLQVLFQIVIASEEGAFDVEDVTEALRNKLVRRHPHIFGDGDARTAEEVYARWEEIKAAEKEPTASVLDGVPDGLPALQRAEAAQRRAASVGFDWDDLEPVMAKVREEARELNEVLSQPERAEEELGDLLFAVVNLSRHLRIDPEVALRRSVGRFDARFRRMEHKADLSGLTLDEMDQIWELVKADPDS
ncbi:MAG: nucleoside triphosphate pyrophosphohydrolase [Acidimicrobiia bacterium]